MPDIFDEVEEDLRAERASSFARRFGWLAAAGVVAVLLGTAAYVWWGQQQQAAAEGTAASFIAAAAQADKSAAGLAGIDRKAAAAAAATFADIAANGPPGYRILARLRLAAVQWELGQKPQALASWSAVSNDTGATQLLRDLATVTSAQHQLDTADPVILKQTMEALTDPKNPWRPMAEQVIALIDIRQGKWREAAGTLKRLQLDPTAPEGIRQMVADLITTLPPEALAPPPPLSPSTGPAPVSSSNAGKQPSPPQAAGPAKPAPHG